MYQISRSIWRIIVILPLTLFLLLRLLQLWVLEKSCSLTNLSRAYWMKVLEKKRKEKTETNILIITTTTITLSYWNTVELPPSDKQTLHFNLPKATTVPTETHLSLTGGSTDCIKFTKKVLSTEIPILRAKIKKNETNMSSKSLGLHQRCELTGCVAEKLWIPKRGL